MGNRRAQLVILLDRYDQRVVAMRRQFDEYAAALEALDPERYAALVEDRKQQDNPIAALEWAQKGSKGDVY